jgi:type IV pilus assembly protein PilW
MNNIANYKLLKQAGFSLVELMVGMVIGLIAVFIITNVFNTFENQKRITTGTADAQTNASIGLFTIQREIQFAGFGLPIFDGDPADSAASNNSALRCAVNNNMVSYYNGALQGTSIDIFPIVITNGAGDSGSDDITIRYGDSPNGGIPTQIFSLASPEFGVANTLGCNNGDLALYVNGTTCATDRVNDTNLTFDTTHVTLTTTTGMGNSGRLSCLGNFTQTVFGVNANQELTRNGNPVMSEIVNLQAQYGISALPASNEIVTWVNATGVWAAPGNTNATCSATVSNRNCIRAVRVAVVSRNNQLENAVVTPGCSSLITANPTGLCSWPGTPAVAGPPLVAAVPAPAIDLTATANWNRYRYRVYETIIPIRNMTFSGALL